MVISLNGSTLFRRIFCQWSFFKCNRDHAKSSYYRSFNFIFGRIGRFVSVETVFDSSVLFISVEFLVGDRFNIEISWTMCRDVIEAAISWRDALATYYAGLSYIRTSIDTLTTHQAGLSSIRTSMDTLIYGHRKRLSWVNTFSFCYSF